jgi:hypothetical protein
MDETLLGGLSGLGRFGAIDPLCPARGCWPCMQATGGVDLDHDQWLWKSDPVRSILTTMNPRFSKR